MAEKLEQQARAEIDRLFAVAGWSMQSIAQGNVHAARGAGIREFPLKDVHGVADYLLYIEPEEFDRAVQTPDQICTIMHTFRDKLISEIVPGRTKAPNALVFASDAKQARKIVKILREELGKGNNVTQKIDCRTPGGGDRGCVDLWAASNYVTG